MIYLKNLPQNILNKYFNSLKQECKVHSDISDVKIHTEIGPPTQYCHWRLLYKDNKYFYKIFNYYDSALPDFMDSTKYDIVFKLAIETNFYDNISLVEDFIYDNINNRYIGYKYPIINEIQNIDNKKAINLIERISKQTKITNIVYTDLVYHNILEYNNQYYIIDLETVTTIDVYNNLHIRNKYFKTNNKIYEKYIYNK